MDLLAHIEVCDLQEGSELMEVEGGILSVISLLSAEV